MNGLTFDTGALVALERRDARMTRVFAAALADGLRITIPTPVITESLTQWVGLEPAVRGLGATPPARGRKANARTEWWRARSAARERILRAVSVEAPDLITTQAAGEALAIVGRGPSVVDAIVMASAARRGDLVYTADVDDLTQLTVVFRTVRVLRV